MTDASERPRVGVGVIIRRNGKILLGKRKNSHGSNTWALPGGHLEFGETPEECALREVAEECGIRLEQVQRGPYTNDLFSSEGRHYITLFILADALGNDSPQILEPEKCERWEWFSWHALPEPLFIPVANLKAGGFNPDVLL
jgi:8-oxo-dGTP diphosphatase